MGRAQVKVSAHVSIILCKKEHIDARIHTCRSYNNACIIFYLSCFYGGGGGGGLIVLLLLRARGMMERIIIIREQSDVPI